MQYRSRGHAMPCLQGLLRLALLTNRRVGRFLVTPHRGTGVAATDVEDGTLLPRSRVREWPWSRTTGPGGG